jgi:dimethylhistidine N-methyltransferase
MRAGNSAGFGSHVGFEEAIMPVQSQSQEISIDRQKTTGHQGGAPSASVREIIQGLSQQTKILPSKLFYDEKGSQLFDSICEQPEYYPTRVELQIMNSHADEMVTWFGEQCLLVEYGSGSGLKTRSLLDRLPRAAGYVAIDISEEHLKRAASATAHAYPEIPVYPIAADFTKPLRLTRKQKDSAKRVVGYFPGSTIGNFEPLEAEAFLRSIRQTCGAGSGLLIGVDLRKDPQILHAAYNDAAGITADFNLNLLSHVNREAGADFDPESFWHYAFYNAPKSRIEMHLVTRYAQTVTIDGMHRIRLEEGESIRTENSYKYTVQSFQQLAEKAGYRPEAVWTDERQYFSVHFMASNEERE